MAEIKQAKFIDQTGQEKDAVFIGAERAIFDDNGKRLDQKLDEMKKATGLVATDKNGLVGGSGEEVSLQALIDGVSNRIINELVTNSALTQTLANYMTKALMSNVQVNDSGKVPTSALAYAMQQAITKNKEDVAKLNSELKKSLYSNVALTKSLVTNLPRNGLYVVFSYGGSPTNEDYTSAYLIYRYNTGDSAKIIPLILANKINVSVDFDTVTMTCSDTNVQMGFSCVN